MKAASSLRSPLGRSLPRPRAWGVGLACAVCLLALPANACRYNVRDVGFVDLETEGYRLRLAPATGVSDTGRQPWTQAAEDGLREGNVSVEWVGSSATPASSDKGAKGVAVVLVAPEGPYEPLPLGVAGTPEALRAVCREALESPTRQSLLEVASRTFGAILLLEGTETEANRRAEEAIREAVDLIRGQLPSLPKPIAEPPGRVTLSPAEFARERVLLWTLRQDTRPTPEPRVAIVYGRGRWIGPVMRGAEITSRNLTGLFSLIGADCECGLDLAWTQGTRLPVRWEEARRGPLVRALGFDPDSPLVRSEVSWIVNRRGSVPAERGRGPGAAGSGTPGSTAEAPAAAPAEVPSAVVPSIGGISASNAAPASAPGPEPRSPMEARILAGTWLGWGLGLLAGLAAVGIGLGLAWRARRRDGS